MYYRINNEPVIENFMTIEDSKPMIYYVCFVLIFILTIVVLWYLGVFSMNRSTNLRKVMPTSLFMSRNNISSTRNNISSDSTSSF